MIYLDLPVPVNCRACACYDALRHDCKAMGLIDREKDNEVGEDKPEWCPINEIVKVETNIYDECERISGCTVEILRNSITGEESVGWYRPKEGNKDAERYPISDARITFDSKKERDEFKASLEKEDEVSDEEWENFPNLDGYIKRRMWEMEQGVKRRREFHICDNCKYFSIDDEDDEFGRCTKHDRVMWSCADACKQFEFKEENE